MTLRTVKYIIKEGAVNTYKNKLMTFASIGIVTATLIIFGIFFMIFLNVSANLKIFGELPEIVVYCDPELDETQAEVIGKEIEKIENVTSVIMVTKLEYFEYVKEMFEENPGLIENIDETFLPVKFNLKLKDFEQYHNEVVDRTREISGVWDVQSPKKVVDFVTRITYWLRFLSYLLIVILTGIAIFIMENTIKLTVHARNQEIGIMKQIGATDWFIRWPFIVEGVIIGFIGAIIAITIVICGYNTIETRINKDIIHIGVDYIRIIKIGDISFLLILLYIMMGTLVGAFGSYMSVRKYLDI